MSRGMHFRMLQPSLDRDKTSSLLCLVRPNFGGVALLLMEEVMPEKEIWTRFLAYNLIRDLTGRRRRRPESIHAGSVSMGLTSPDGVPAGRRNTPLRNVVACSWRWCWRRSRTARW